MVKQLSATIIFLPMRHVLEAIHCTRAIFEFTILIQYLLHNNKTFFYIKHTLYRLDKTKIVFENHCQINIKLF